MVAPRAACMRDALHAVDEHRTRFGTDAERGLRRLQQSRHGRRIGRGALDERQDLAENVREGPLARHCDARTLNQANWRR